MGKISQVLSLDEELLEIKDHQEKENKPFPGVSPLIGYLVPSSHPLTSMHMNNIKWNQQLYTYLYMHLCNKNN